MIHFNPILKPITTINNYKMCKKPQISFCANDTFEKSYECYDVQCNIDKNACSEEFPQDYLYTKDKKTYLKPHYMILHLESLKKGGGTMAIKSVLKKSLENPLTQGRIVLFSTTLDGKSYPSGFYYKMGFRLTEENKNRVLENWLAAGGKKEISPRIEGTMYLPKENIEHCLNY